jgi:hypothetical protein
MRIFLSVIAGVALSIIATALFKRRFSFAAQRPEDYVMAGPEFRIREHLNGPIQCEGVIYGPTGRVASRFVADFDASWQGNVGRMIEKFEYDSGTMQDREWVLTVSNDGAIQATAPDVIGTATGQQAGNSVVLNYRIKLADAAGGHVLDATDWMYLMANGTIMNRSQFRKYGIKVAELVATMRPKAA